MRLAGHPTYTPPASATSPDVKRVCSQSMLLSSIDAPDSKREPDRKAQLQRQISTDEKEKGKEVNIPIADFQRVESKVSTRVDMCHDRAVVQRDLVAELNQIRLGHQTRLATRIDRTVLANLGAQRAEVPHDEERARQRRQDTTVAVALVQRTREGQVQLPALAVAALVPLVAAGSSATDDHPLGDDDPEKRDERLDVARCDERAGDQRIYNPEAIPHVVEETVLPKVDADLAERLRTRDSGDGPVCRRETRDGDVYQEEYRVRDDEEVGLAFIERAPERCRGVTMGIGILGAFVEADGLAAI